MTQDLPDLGRVRFADAARARAFAAWIAQLAPEHGLNPGSLRAASSDASFRRYLRIDTAQGSRIIMDAPPAHEDCEPFVHVAALLQAGGVHVPTVRAWSREQGFLLLDDLGDQTYLQALSQAESEAQPALARQLMDDATAALIRLQRIDAAGQVPPYDEALLQRELDLFPQWYIARHCGITWSATQQAQWTQACTALLANNLAQPRVLVHRDFHSRNLMVSAPNPGVLDFQDAVHGPITYDLVSLLRDAYITWEEEQQLDIALRYWEPARKAGLPVQADFGEFWRDVEWMGMQRLLKVLGIFARLFHRDGKDGYLADMPRVWRHAHATAMRYRELKPLAPLLEQAAGVQRQEGYTF